MYFLNCAQQSKCQIFFIQTSSDKILTEKRVPRNLETPENTGVRERIRTAGLPLRRRSLYPAELRKHVVDYIPNELGWQILYAIVTWENKNAELRSKVRIKVHVLWYPPVRKIDRRIFI